MVGLKGSLVMARGFHLFGFIVLMQVCGPPLIRLLTLILEKIPFFSFPHITLFIYYFFSLQTHSMRDPFFVWKEDASSLLKYIFFFIETEHPNSIARKVKFSPTNISIFLYLVLHPPLLCNLLQYFFESEVFIYTVPMYSVYCEQAPSESPEVIHVINLSGPSHIYQQFIAHESEIEQLVIK